MVTSYGKCRLRSNLHNQFPHLISATAECCTAYCALLGAAPSDKSVRAGGPDEKRRHDASSHTPNEFKCQHGPRDDKRPREVGGEWEWNHRSQCSTMHRGCFLGQGVVCRGGGGRKGTILWGNFFFQFGVEISPTNFFAQFWALPACASSVELVPPSVWRANLGLAPFFFVSLMSWYCSKFGSNKVSHNCLSTRNQGLGC